MPRDDFPPKVKRLVAERVNYHCSRCDRRTAGPHSDPAKRVLLGVAAHITAAAPGSPRYDPQMSTEERKSQNNAIWLCELCGNLVDSDKERFSVGELLALKRRAEDAARDALTRSRKTVAKDPLTQESDVATCLYLPRSFVRSSDLKPSSLLRPENEIVPFHLRDRETEWFRRWVSTDNDVSIQLMKAPRGNGKTRLGIEWVREVAEDETWPASWIGSRWNVSPALQIGCCSRKLGYFWSATTPT